MALGVLDASPEPDVARRFELLCAIGAAAWRTSDVARAREIFLEAAQLARQLGDPERLARAALGFGGSGFRPWWTEQGLVDELLVELLEGALEGLPGDDSVLRVELLGLLSQQLYFVGNDERQPQLASESLAMARRLAEPVTLVRGLCARGGSPDGTSQTCMSVSRCATRRQKSLVTSTDGALDAGALAPVRRSHGAR